MAKVRSRKQDIAWQYLFDRFDIPNQIEKYGGFEITSSDINKALLSRLWTGFFDTARCRYTEKFSKPRFQPKMA